MRGSPDIFSAGVVGNTYLLIRGIANGTRHLEIKLGKDDRIKGMKTSKMPQKKLQDVCLNKKHSHFHMINPHQQLQVNKGCQSEA